MEEIDVFKSLRESVDGELAPIVDEREAARLKLIADHKKGEENGKRKFDRQGRPYAAGNVKGNMW